MKRLFSRLLAALLSGVLFLQLAPLEVFAVQQGEQLDVTDMAGVYNSLSEEEKASLDPEALEILQGMAQNEGFGADLSGAEANQQLIELLAAYSEEGATVPIGEGISESDLEPAQAAEGEGGETALTEPEQLESEILALYGSGSTLAIDPYNDAAIDDGSSLTVSEDGASASGSNAAVAAAIAGSPAASRATGVEPGLYIAANAVLGSGKYTVTYKCMKNGAQCAAPYNITFKVALLNGSAVAGTNFTAPAVPSTLTITANQNAVSMEIPFTVDSDLFKGSKYFYAYAYDCALAGFEPSQSQSREFVGKAAGLVTKLSISASASNSIYIEKIRSLLGPASPGTPYSMEQVDCFGKYSTARTKSYCTSLENVAKHADPKCYDGNTSFLNYFSKSVLFNKNFHYDVWSTAFKDYKDVYGNDRGYRGDLVKLYNAGIFNAIDYQVMSTVNSRNVNDKGWVKVCFKGVTDKLYNFSGYTTTDPVYTSYRYKSSHSELKQTYYFENRRVVGQIKGDELLSYLNSDNMEIKIRCERGDQLVFVPFFFNDSLAPTVKSITAPEGVVFANFDYVPVTVEFNEPVRANADLKVWLDDGGFITPAVIGDVSRRIVFHYPVKERDNTRLSVSKVTGIQDAYGNTTATDTAFLNNNRYYTVSGGVDGKYINTPLAQLAFKTAPAFDTPSANGYTPKDTAVKVTLDLNYDTDETKSLSSWINPINNGVWLSPDNGRTFFKAAYKKDASGNSIVDKLQATVDFSQVNQRYVKNYLTVWYSKTSASSNDAKPVFGATTKFKYTPIFVGFMSASYMKKTGTDPAVKTAIASGDAIEVAEMGEGKGVVFAAYAASDDKGIDVTKYVAWSVANDDASKREPIAEMDGNTLYPTGLAYGKVNVTATSPSGQTAEFELTINRTAACSEFTGAPLTIKRGEAVNLRWFYSDGSGEEVATSPTYNVRLYNADENGQKTGEPVREWLNLRGVVSQAVEANVLNGLSRLGGQGAYLPRYIVEVTVASANLKSAESPSLAAPAETPPEETPAAETPATETPVTETPTTETPAVETPTTETPTTETPATETPTTETPAVETPTTETSTTETPTTETPVTVASTTEPPTALASTTEIHSTEASTAETPTTETPSTETPTTENPTAETPTTETPTTETPTTETPTTETPSTETPTTETPTTETPTTETPTTETPTTETPTAETPVAAASAPNAVAYGSAPQSCSLGIVVTPKPIEIKFTGEEEDFYKLYTGAAISVSGELKNYMSGDTVACAVSRGSESIASRITTSGSSFTVTFTPQVVSANALKDIYYVEVRATCGADTSLVYTDKAPVQIYNKSSIKVDVTDTAGNVTTVTSGETGRSVTMNNVSEIPVLKNFTGVWTQANSSSILALKREIVIQRMLGINYNNGAYKWNNAQDMFTWENSNDLAATVNYRNGSMFENMYNFETQDYRPDAKLLLSGLGDGSTDVKATHDLTGAEVGFKVNVSTLKNKLYIFRVSPKCEADMVYYAYTNAAKTATVKRTFTTDANGEAAIYEPYGISSDVYFTGKAKSREFPGEDATYKGAIALTSLVSQEGDAAKKDLYPLNALELMEASILKVYLKTDEKTNYSGQVRYSYGVYKNGEYCPKACTEPNLPKTKKTATVGANGELIIKFDTSMFLTQKEIDAGKQQATLAATDIIQYVVETEFASASAPDNYTYYRPTVIEAFSQINADMAVYVADNHVFLEKPAVAGAKDAAPYVDSYLTRYPDAIDNVYDATRNVKHVGVTTDYPKVTLSTRVLWWGEQGKSEAAVKSGKYKLEIADKNGKKMLNQKQESFVYPFGTIPVSASYLNMSDTMGVPGGSAMRCKTVITDSAGKEIARLEQPFKIINLVGMASVKSVRRGQPITGTAKVRAGKVNSSDSSVSSSSGKIGWGLPDLLPVSFQFSPTEEAGVWSFIGSICIAGRSSPEGEEPSVKKFGKTPSEKLAKVKNKMKGFANNIDNWKNFNKQSGAGKGTWDVTVYGYCFGLARVSGGSIKFDTLTFQVTAGAAASYKYNFNGTVGPVPVTYSIEAGALFEFSLGIGSASFADPYIDGKASNFHLDLMLTIKLLAYVKAFGGVGVDFDIVACKIGVYGSIELPVVFKSMWRPYLEKPEDYDESYYNEIHLFGGLTGEAGLKFELRLVVFSYSKILVSSGKFSIASAFANMRGMAPMSKQMYDSLQKDGGDMTKLKNRWDPTKPESEQSSGDSGSGEEYGETAGAYDSYDLSSLSGMDVAASSFTAGGDAAASGDTFDSSTNAIDVNWNDMYAAANPVVGRDGKIMVLLTDKGSTSVDDMGVAWAQQNAAGTGYEARALISDGLTACSNPSIDGSESFSVAAWEQQKGATGLAAGSEVDVDTVNETLDNSEIAVSVYKNGAWSAPLKLTNNDLPDLAPAVATNGTNAIVMWRQSKSDGQTELLNFNVVNQLLYSYYDGSNWSDVRVLDSGSLGAFKGCDVAMATDGSACVVSSVQTTGNVANSSPEALETNNDSLEIAYQMIDSSGALNGTRTRLTANKSSDSSPQVVFAGGKYLAAWFSSVKKTIETDDGQTSVVSDNDVKLAAIDTNGVRDDSFADSLSKILEGDYNLFDNKEDGIGSAFTLATSAASNPALEDVALLWKGTTVKKEPLPQDATYEAATTETGASDTVYAVKFCTVGGRAAVTAPSAVKQMDDYTAADLVNAYVTNDNGARKINTVVFASTANVADKSSYQSYLTGLQYDETANGGAGGYTGTVLKIPSTTCKLVVGEPKVCENAIELVSEPYFRSDLVEAGAELPITFEILNAGVSPITQIAGSAGGANARTLTGLNIMPGDTVGLNIFYSTSTDASSAITDPDYSVTATFEDGTTKTLTGSVDITLPDVALGSAAVVDAKNGVREIEVNSYNNSAVDYDASSGVAKMVVEFSEDSGFAAPMSDVVVEGLAGGVKEYTGDVLGMVDDGAHVVHAAYTVPDSVLVDGEIPEGGVNFYVRSQLKNAAGDVLTDGDITDNISGVHIESLLDYSDPNALTVDFSAALDPAANPSRAVITARNLSMQTSPDIAASAINLLDENGSVIETKPLATAALTLAREEVRNVSVAFTRQGSAVSVAPCIAADYGTTETRGLKALGASSMSCDEAFDAYDTSYSFSGANLDKTTITAVAINPDDSVLLCDGELVLASAVGTLAVTVPLSAGLKSYTVKVVSDLASLGAVDDEYSDYTVELSNTQNTLGTAAISLALEAGKTMSATGWTNSPSVSAYMNVGSGLEPASMSYTVGGASQTSTAIAGKTKALMTNVNAEGVTQLSGEVLDTAGASIDAGSKTVRIDTHAPEMLKTDFQYELLVPGSANWSDEYASCAKPALITIKAADALSGIASVSAHVDGRLTDMRDLDSDSAIGGSPLGLADGDSYTLFAENYDTLYYFTATDGAGNTARVDIKPMPTPEPPSGSGGEAGGGTTAAGGYGGYSGGAKQGEIVVPLTGEEGSRQISGERLAELVEQNRSHTITFENEDGSLTLSFEPGTLAENDAGVTLFMRLLADEEEHAARGSGEIEGLAAIARLTGDMPGSRATLKIKLGEEYNGRALYLLRWNGETGELELVQTDTVRDGVLTVSIDSLGDYIIAEKYLGEEAPADAPQSSGGVQSVPALEEKKPLSVWAIVIIIAAAIALAAFLIFIIIKRRREKEEKPADDTRDKRDKRERNPKKQRR